VASEQNTPQLTDPRSPLDRSPGLVVLHGTMSAPCAYLANRLERRLVVDLGRPSAGGAYDALAQAGFRRSHGLAYRPACAGCTACVPIRVPVESFLPNRTQRRILARNRDLQAGWTQAAASKEQYRLFRRYLEARHGDGEMVNMRFADYRGMVEDSPVATGLIEHRQADGSLAAVMLADRLADGLSAVYSFFDPDLDGRSLGTFMVLELIGRARLIGLRHAYLGYWISGSRKMSYKTQFRPYELFDHNGWRRLDHPS
jgi:arginine-tRNA-protein transferase